VQRSGSGSGSGKTSRKPQSEQQAETAPDRKTGGSWNPLIRNQNPESVRKTTAFQTALIEQKKSKILDKKCLQLSKAFDKI